MSEQNLVAATHSAPKPDFDTWWRQYTKGNTYEMAEYYAATAAWEAAHAAIFERSGYQPVGISGPVAPPPRKP